MKDNRMGRFNEIIGAAAAINYEVSNEEAKYLFDSLLFEMAAITIPTKKEFMERRNEGCRATK